MDDDQLRRLILTHALDNAQRHDGAAQIGAVMGSLMGGSPELRPRAKEVKALTLEIIAEVNAMDEATREAKHAELVPEPMGKKESKRTGLPPLAGAEDGKVVTRFPPEPNGFPHIGHAYSALINYLYAKMYDGRLVLRFEDTNPRKEEVRYYDAIKEGLTWLGIEWDEELRVSDEIPLIIEQADRLLRGGHLYICDCPAETISANRRAGRPCSHRDRSIEENVALWESMNARMVGEGEIGVRLKADMEAENMVMRDPMMLRVIDHPHPLHGDKYYVYPTYDFAVAIQDSRRGITHVLRSNEFQPRIELQEYIRGLLGLPNPRIMQYSRFSLEGTPTSKRLIKALLDEGVVEGWDDPRLSTLAGLRRRGIVPKTLEDLSVEIGPSTAEPVISWKLLAGINRKNIDRLAYRAFVVVDAIELNVEEAPERTARLKRHPGNPEMGERTFETGALFCITREDADNLQEGDVVRLKDLYNVRIEGRDEHTGRILAVYDGDEVVRGMTKLHWVPKRTAVKVHVYFPGMLEDGNGERIADSMPVKRALGEPPLKVAHPGDLVQMERMGFGRIDRITDGVVHIIYAHD